MTTKIFIDVDAIGRGKVIVDGIDVAKYVSGITVATQAGELSKVQLHIPANFAADMIADVDVSIVPIAKIVAQKLRESEEDETRL